MIAEEKARALIEAARARGWKIATAESCTGGLVSAAITDVAGSSDVFDRGFVTYSYPAKVAMLGVPQLLLTDHGAVSEPVARAMAEGALAASDAEVAVAMSLLVTEFWTARSMVTMVNPNPTPSTPIASHTAR